MPADVRACYSEAERAALSVIAEQCKRRGFCDLSLDEIADLAGVRRTSVQNALRKARSKEFAHVSVRERPQSGRKNLTNIIKIICRSWLSWITRAIGFKRLSTSETVEKNSPSEGVELTKLALERESASSLFERLVRRAGGSEEVRFRLRTKTAESAPIPTGALVSPFPK
jgi:AcrR family transcriptional regulator